MSEHIGGGSPLPESLSLDSEGKSVRGRNFKVIAGAVVTGLLLGGGALFFLTPSSSVEDTGPIAKGKPPAGATRANAAPTASPSASPTGSASPSVQTGRSLTSRDPFAPLVEPSPTAAPTPASSGSSADSGADTTSSADTQSAATGATISALAISTAGDSVTLKLDGKKYKVDEGETFADTYRLYDIFNANCAGFLYGDTNAVVCEGDQVSIG